MKIVLLNVEQAQSIYRSQMVRDFPESELKPFASVQGMMTRGLYEPLAFYDEAGALMAYAWQAVLPQCRNVLLDYFAVLPQYRGRAEPEPRLHPPKQRTPEWAAALCLLIYYL